MDLDTHSAGPPVTVSIRITHLSSLVTTAATTDDVSIALDYEKLSRSIQADIRAKFQKLDGRDIVDGGDKAGEVEVRVHLLSYLQRED